MNQGFDFFRNRIGLRDAKQLAKALHRAIQTTSPISRDSARQLVFTLPWPPFRAEDAPPTAQVAHVLPEEADPCHADLVTWDPQHPCSFVTLGNCDSLPQEDLFPQDHALHWTHRGALMGGLVFGPQQERRAVLEGMVSQAGLAGQSVLWVTEAPDTHHVDRLAQALAKQGQAHRLRSINLLPGGATHTFNPMAQHSASSICETLVQALGDHCPLMNMSSADWTRFLITAMSAIAFAMVYHCEQQKQVPDIALFLDLCDLSKLKELAQQEAFPTPLRASIQFFLREANQLPEGYDTVLNWFHREEVLGAMAGTFGHVFNTQCAGGQACLPDVSIRDIAYGDLVTVVTLPSGAAVPTRWILNQLGLECYVRSNREHVTNTVNQLVVLDSVGSYGTKVILNRLQRFAAAIGVATVLADENYPALLRMGTEAQESVGRCHTKLFASASEGPNVLQVLEGHQLHRLIRPTALLPANVPAYVPRARGRMLQSSQAQYDLFLERAADVLWKSAHEHTDSVNLAWCQNTLARMLGYAHWHELEQQKRR